MLTYNQIDFIKKQYHKFVMNDITVNQVNLNLQKYFNTNKNLTDTLNYCKHYNKGYSLLTWEF